MIVREGRLDPACDVIVAGPGVAGMAAALFAAIGGARVLDVEGRPNQGLSAVGNDMASLMRGRYPAGGITLGPAMTFGYTAAHHAAGVPLFNNRNGTGDG